MIDGNGLVLTIGYLMVEAHNAELITNDGRTVPANIVGYDHETGFGLLQAVAPLKLRAMPIGKSADLKTGDPVLASSFGGRDGTVPAYVASRREFVGTWEYLVDSAIYTVPAHSHWSGAALINREGKLVGRRLADRRRRRRQGRRRCRQYVCADRSAAADPCRPDRRRPPGGGAEALARRQRRSLQAGGLSRQPRHPAKPGGSRRHQARRPHCRGQRRRARQLADFYRKIWALGNAGAVVPLDIEREGSKQHFDVKSMNRLDHLKLKSTF